MKTNPSPNPPDPMTDTGNIAKTLLDAGAARAGIAFIPAQPTEGGVPVTVVPDGYELRVLPLNKLEEFAGKPNRKTGHFNFADTDSFVRYFKEHRNADSRIFAKLDPDGATFTGYLNFHGEQPSFNDHVCKLMLKHTRQFARFINANESEMSQIEFAAFLEENQDWFVSPDGADLLELISTLEGKAHVDIQQAVKLQTGAINLKFTETIELRGSTTQTPGEMTVPKTFTVRMPLFEGTSNVQMTARLRYRIENKKITFWYNIVDVFEHVRHAVEDVITDIESNTNVLPFRV